VILREGINCWRVARADRGAFLIDAAAYFAVLRDALAQARREVMILGWDVDSRVCLVPHTDPSRDRAPRSLLSYLNYLLRRRPELRVHVLSWDFSIIYTLEREALPAARFGWKGERGLKFRLDGLHPVMGSHHQKIVTIDRRLAFVGGLDLAIRRWDTPAHRVREPARVDPVGKPYPPMHDVQMMVDGAAARAVGDLAAERWRRAAGEALPPPDAVDLAEPGADPWPAGVVPDFTDAPIGIARTEPALDERPPCTEILALTLDLIASAQRVIYIEAQYLTSAAVGHALARSLAAPDGPEIVAVVPRDQSGWLERNSMGVMRTRLLRRLRAADRHGRLRVLHPVVPGLGEECVNVHSKVFIVDDVVARVGSANLSNRSMGLDTECDLALDATADGAKSAQRRAVAAFRNRLLAEHLGVEPTRVEAEIEAAGSVIGAIAALSGGPRTLEPLPESTEDPDAELNLAFMDGLVADPERPAPDVVIEDVVAPPARRPALRSLVAWTIAVAAVAALVATWRLTPLRALLDVERLASLGRALAAQPAAPFLVFTAFAAGALVFFPITLLLTATALVFSPARALAYGLGGALVGAALSYGVGRLVGRHRPRWLERPSVERLRRALERRGILAVVVMRILPVGNFTLINIAAGAMGVKLRDFLLGSAIGLLPGTLALTVFADRLGYVLLHPGVGGLVVLAVVTVLLLGALTVGRRLLTRAVGRTRDRRG
jgi:phosphatidylserine/phosphatidylglycerophosphate/cardiolipin synthase-like enzyme/uncharacterized membrane protein YdjX (TVP38/TMEM64 family)